ncbi:HAMP domain-containing protein [Pseudomonas hunanensis]|uniref:HAMP domain-containing protein n=1 Tax=Pseudomonas hunanensis TaxID=1247546 RepID=UPI0037F4C4F6
MVKAMDELNLRVEALSTWFKDPADLRWIRQAQNAIKAYRSHFQSYVLSIESHRDAEATLTLAELGTDLQSLLEAAGHLSDIQTQKRDDEVQSFKQRLIFATVLALVFGVLAAWLSTRLIVLPLKDALQSAERVAGGDLSQDIQVSRRDELGDCRPACSA